MKTDRPILLEAIAFGVFTFLIVGVSLMLLIPAYSSPSTPQEQAAAERAAWLVTATSVLVAALAGYGYWRYQRKRLPPTDEEPRCENCGYILRGLPEPRCPECGEPFADDGKG
jgi:hypothetical protein